MSTLDFPECRQRGEPLTAQLHRCRSPKLAGSKLVTADTCWGCYCRDPREPTAPATAPDLLPGLPDPLPFAELSPVPPGWACRPAVRDQHVAALRKLLAVRFPGPEKAVGTGAVFCGGGRYWPMITVALRMLRDVSGLPVRVYYRGVHEPVNAADVADLPGVELIDATQLRPVRILRGWEIKTVALLDCPWERVLYLDADAYPVADPAPLLARCDAEHPFLFWQDLPDHDGAVGWPWFGLPGSDHVPCIQGGQLVIHRKAFWRELVLSHWLNQHSDYTYHHPQNAPAERHGYGDQDQYRVALAATGGRYLCLGRSPWVGPAFVLPFEGQPMIVHRPQGKLWGLGTDKRAAHLPGEARVFDHLNRFLIGTGEAGEVFGRIYSRGLWGHGDRSGGGSTEEAGRPYLNFVNHLIRKIAPRRVVDLGCGDGYLAQRISAPSLIGVDVHWPHVQRLRREAPAYQWECLDLDRDRDRLPAGEVAFLKDILHHWPNALVLDWLAWAKAARKWKWLIMTQDRLQQEAGQDCPLGGYRGLDLRLAPLRQVEGLRVISEYLHKAVVLLDCQTGHLPRR